VNQRDLAAISEDELLTAVLDLLQLYNWRTLHIRPARTAWGWETPIQGQGKGFPDILAAGHGRLIFAELKSKLGRLTSEQVAWIEALVAAKQDVYIWRPSDLPSIAAILRG
jgi:hypothetical protein